MWLQDKSSHHQIHQLWDEKGYACLARIQIFYDGSAAYWFNKGEVAKSAASLSAAKRLVALHFIGENKS